MEKLNFNKLVRDKISDKLKEKGLKFETRELSDEEFLEELLKKIPEEVEELLQATTQEEFIEEFADIINLLEEVRDAKGILNVDLEKARRKNREQKGGFKKRHFLLWTEDDGYKK